MSFGGLKDVTFEEHIVDTFDPQNMSLDVSKMTPFEVPKETSFEVPRVVFVDIPSALPIAKRIQQPTPIKHPPWNLSYVHGIILPNVNDKIICRYKLDWCIELKHFKKFQRSWTFKEPIQGAKSLKSDLKQSSHFRLGRPFLLAPSTVIDSTLLTASDGTRLRTCPNHRSLPSLNFLETDTTPKDILIAEFVVISLRVLPHDDSGDHEEQMVKSYQLTPELIAHLSWTFELARDLISAGELHHHHHHTEYFKYGLSQFLWIRTFSRRVAIPRGAFSQGAGQRLIFIQAYNSRTSVLVNPRSGHNKAIYSLLPKRVDLPYITKLSQLPGEMAIGHLRYSTAGSSMLKNVQPFVVGYRFTSVGVAHNGNLVNYTALRHILKDNGSIFNTSSDTEVVLHLIAISKEEDKLVAVRDSHGFRPLVMGRRSNGAVVFASETCALDLIEATYEREVNHGEVLVVDKKDAVQSLCLLPHPDAKQCIFEHIYFALPNSVVFGRSVYESRHAFGEILAIEAPVDCDVVIAVPDSGVVAALGYAAKAGVPFQQGLIRSHYVGRTFIEPSQKIRDFGVKLKLSPVRGVLEGKRVVVVDDSIVRGTTSSKIVRLLKEAGAKEVHMRIASPPFIASFYYGVDSPSSEELISNQMSVEEIREFIGCDSLAFLPFDSLKKMLASDSQTFC
ncbi:Amidophosphoribosyltransferase [Hibiscus syriacus]|uniref:Amidophosphoribosyltransferase n=1 Tax=Hibiscus syriacus TaxID=106335 RepID=A0A6A2X550_HIBSY|nr:Amidophosphoribosyltransferase [Hibiscus syriacus]